MSNSKKKVAVNEHYDLVIIGAGAVGITLLATILSIITNNQLKIAIIDKQLIIPNAKQHEISISRATALNFGTKYIYEQIDIWQYFEKNITPIEKVIVKESLNTSCNLFTDKDQKTDLGYVVPHCKLQSILQQQLLEYVKNADVTLLDNQTVCKLTPAVDSMLLTLDNNDIISANLVVVADGGSSKFMSALGIYQQTTSYNQTAIITNVQLSHSHNNTAYEYFTELGSIALLPQQENKAGIVWTVDNNNLDYFKQLSNKHFLHNLQHNFGKTNNIIFSSVADRCYYPMNMRLSSEQVRSNLVILGNAAHAIHPIAAQGYNLATRCCALLAKNIYNSLEQEHSIGSLTNLLEYEKLAKKEQQPIICCCDKIVKVFSDKSYKIKNIRNIALFLLDKSFYTKRYFVRKAMGMPPVF